MPVYKAPLRDTRFLLNEVFDFPEHYRNLVNGAEATPDMVDAILGECAKLCEEVIAPLYHSGDEKAATWRTAKYGRRRATRKPTRPTSPAAGRASRTRWSTAARACR